MSTARGTHPVDAHVGGKLKARRQALGMSQTAVGEAVGLTFQQVQKYESGFNRISASKLYEFATVLGLEPGDFFIGMPRGVLKGLPAGQARRGRRIHQ